MNLTNGDKPEQFRAGQVSADYFRLFGAPIVQGRSFSTDENRPNGDKVVVLLILSWHLCMVDDNNVSCLGDRFESEAQLFPHCRKDRRRRIPAWFSFVADIQPRQVRGIIQREIEESVEVRSIFNDAVNRSSKKLNQLRDRL